MKSKYVCVYLCATGGKERERERQREKKREKEREKKREKEREKERERGKRARQPREDLISTQKTTRRHRS